MRLGLDFDNTIICYDRLFHRVALEMGLIPKDVIASKNSVRDYLRQHGKEPEWTLMQGEVYGVRIKEAEPFPSVVSSLSELAKGNASMYIVSHKTSTPLQGPRYDLHQAAYGWLTHSGFFSPQGLNFGPTSVFFEQTKEEKVRRILDLGCSHYIDDLPEILEMLPDSVQRILFAPGGQETIPYSWRQFHHWGSLAQVLAL